MNANGKSLESWIWDAACSIRGAKDAPKYKEFILPYINSQANNYIEQISIRAMSEAIGAGNTEHFVRGSEKGTAAGS